MKIFLKQNRNELLLSVIGWVIACNLFVVIRYYGLEAEIGLLTVINPLELGTIHLAITMIGILMGLFTGWIDNIVRKRGVRQRTYGFILVVQSGFYLLIFCIAIVTFSYLFHFSLGHPIEHANQELSSIFGTLRIVVILSYALVASLLIIFLKLVNRKFGPGILWQMIIGKYHRPVEEERIFMFMDLKSSTTHAEKLGHKLYSNLIQDCFYDLSKVIEKYHSEIYQYVGDEAVLTWKLENGLANSNCIMVYFAFMKYLDSKSDYYKGKYGFVPFFKAGVNSGIVTIAEVGEIKKEIAYHGDVLNTASRVQEFCNEFKSEILVTEYLANKMDESTMNFSLISEVELRGRKGSVKIFAPIMDSALMLGSGKGN